MVEKAMAAKMPGSVQSAGRARTKSQEDLSEKDEFHQP